MSNLITPSVTFAPGGAGAGTLDFSGYAAFDIRALVGVVNVKSGAVVYARGVPGFGYTSLSGSVVTLQASTSGMSSGDALSIKYDRRDGSAGTDWSINAATVTGSPLLTIAVNPNRAKISIQNQSPSQIKIVRDDGNGLQQTSILLKPGGNVANIAGDIWESATFKGRLRVYGPAGSQIGAYED